MGISVLLLLVNLPQADANLCGDTVNVIVKDLFDVEIFSTSGIVPFGGSFEIFGTADIDFEVFCDGRLFWDYSTTAGIPLPVSSHSVWWTDLMWTNVPGGKVVDFFVVLNPSCDAPIQTTGFTDSSAHAFVDGFIIVPSQDLFCELQIISQHPVGGEIIPLDSTMVLVAGAHSVAAWMIPVILSAIGIGIVIARKF